MIKRLLINLSITLFFVLGQSVYAGTSGLLFNVTATGQPAMIDITLCLNGKGAISCQNHTVSALNLNIKTTLPNHTYPAAGIKINTPGYLLANLGLECTANSNGFCLFSVNNTQPATIFISQSRGYSISGAISNLTADGLVLLNNGSDYLTTASGTNSFQFSKPVAFGDSYNVTVLQQPTGLICTVSNGMGTNVMADVTNIQVNCAPYVLVTNRNTNTISRCQVNGSTLIACSDSGASDLSSPSGIILNAAGTTAFITNSNNNTITQCTVNSNELSACSNSGASALDAPIKIILNAAGTTAFITNFSNNTVTQCSVSGNTLSACSDSGASGLNSPQGIVLNKAENTVFITNYNNNSITQCAVSGSTLSFCNNAGASELSQPSAIVLNAAGTTAFITNFSNNTVTQCTVSGNTLSACSNSGASGLTSPQGIVLDTAGTTSFITNYWDNTITQCTVSGNTLSACSNSGALEQDRPGDIILFP